MYGWIYNYVYNSNSAETHIQLYLLPGAAPEGSGFFSTNAQATLLDSVLCSTSKERALKDCSHTLFNNRQCSHDAAVICQGIVTILSICLSSLSDSMYM